MLQYWLHDDPMQIELIAKKTPPSTLGSEIILFLLSRTLSERRNILNPHAPHFSLRLFIIAKRLKLVWRRRQKWEVRLFRQAAARATGWNTCSL
jgi:hypothetical protein